MWDWRDLLRELVREGGEMLVLGMEGEDSVLWCLQRLRRELGSKERECGGGCIFSVLNYRMTMRDEYVSCN